ncbi:MAG TPA: ABC transporter ATP-binding protein [Acidimicrobiia bacterium]|nr:ABC transporter ATP-binding protein [Acidimicrobiia bacterium]
MVTQLSVSDLSFSYPDGTEVLKQVSLEIAPGEKVGLLGPNGAGKTTFVLHLNGILRASSGSINLGGITLSDETLREIRRRVGLVFQDPDDQLFMPTVFADVAFGPANFGFAPEEVEHRVRGALESVGEWHLADRAPHHLSGGERRKVAIATVLASDSELLVLDEPTSNLDPAGRRELVALLSSLPTTQLIVTHDLPFVFELCPRSIIMDGGRVVADGRTGELLSNRQLMAAHRLELPFGFDPTNIATR